MATKTERTLDTNRFIPESDADAFAPLLDTQTNRIVDALGALRIPTVVCNTTELDAGIATAAGQTIVQTLKVAGASGIASLFSENNSSVSVSIYAGESINGRFLVVIPPYSWKAVPVPDYVTSLTVAIPAGSYGLVRITGSTAPERSVGEGPTTTGVPVSYSGSAPTAVSATTDTTIAVVPANRMLIITDIFVSSTVVASLRFQLQAGVGGTTIFDGYLQPNASFQLSALANVPAIVAGTIVNLHTFATDTAIHAVSYTLLGQLR